MKEVVNYSYYKFNKKCIKERLKLKAEVISLMKTLYQALIILKYDHANLYAQNDNESANANTTV